MAKSLIAGLISFLLFLCAHIFLFHKFAVRRKFRALILIVLAVVIINYFLFSIIPSGLFSPDILQILAVLNAVFLYLFCCYFYIHLIVVMDRSVSVRMIVELYRSQGRGLSLDEIKQRYRLDEKFKDELQDMVFLKRLHEENGGYKNTGKGAFHARVVKFLRNYLNLAKNR